MNLQEYQNQKIEYRVIKNTTSPENKEKNEMVGGIFEQHAIYDDGCIYLWTKDKTIYWIFKSQDIQKLTPISHNEYRIGIGDIVESTYGTFEVFDHGFFSGVWKLRGSKIENGQADYNNTWTISESDINSVTPLHLNEKEQWEKQGIEKGWIKEGKIVS